MKIWRRLDQIELTCAGVKPDEHGIGTERYCVTNHIASAGNVKNGMLINGFLNRSSIIRGAISFNSERTYIDPIRSGRQLTNRERLRGWHGIERRSLVTSLDLSTRAQSGQGKSVGEGSYSVYLTGSGKLASALAKPGKGRHMAANDILHIDLGHAAVFITDDDRGAADVLEARILDPKFVGIVRID